MTRGFAPIIGLIAALAPAVAHAQTNLDQGKSAAQIFSAACAECHKAARGLANGKNSAALTEFLGEHYTTSREQAAALAAYVLGGRGSEPIGTAGQGKKPQAAEPAGATAEEPKPAKRQAQKPAKPEEGASANAKPRRPMDAEAKPKEDASPGQVPSLVNPLVRPEGGHQNRPATASRNRPKEPKTPEPTSEPAAVARVPAAVVAEPAHAQTPSQEAAPGPATTDAAPGEPGESVPVPRDDVPD